MPIVDESKQNKGVNNNTQNKKVYRAQDIWKFNPNEYK